MNARKCVMLTAAFLSFIIFAAECQDFVHFCLIFLFLSVLLFLPVFLSWPHGQNSCSEERQCVNVSISVLRWSVGSGLVAV